MYLNTVELAIASFKTQDVFHLVGAYVVSKQLGVVALRSVQHVPGEDAVGLLV